MRAMHKLVLSPADGKEVWVTDLNFRYLNQCYGIRRLGCLSKQEVETEHKMFLNRMRDNANAQPLQLTYDPKPKLTLV